MHLCIVDNCGLWWRSASQSLYVRILAVFSVHLLDLRNRLFHGFLPQFLAALVHVRLCCLLALVRRSTGCGICLLLLVIKATAVINAVVPPHEACPHPLLKICPVTGVELYKKCTPLGQVAMLNHKSPDGIHVCPRLVTGWRMAATVHVD